MILLGQYDSPFVRRIAVTLHHYRLPFEHRAWSVWADADKIAQYNPLRRVPTLLLDDGSVLVETFPVLDALDEFIDPERRMLAASGSLRRDALRIAALSAGIADKSVQLLYGSLELMKPSESWTARCRTQVLETLTLLEAQRAPRSTPYWLGEALGYADVAFACSYRFSAEAHPDLIGPRQFPSLAAQAARCEALPEFQRAYQPITNNVTNP